MKNLRVLKIDELHIDGDLQLLSKELRWFSWKQCPLKYIPSNFPSENLVILDMQKSNIQEFGPKLQGCKSLKKLDLSDCKQLRKSPNFDGSHSLETLKLAGCSSLTEIHRSIGNLERLVMLNLFACHNLKDLPSSLCQLNSLKLLDIRDCSSIKTLPNDIGRMQSLTDLLGDGTSIKQMPGSVGMLRYINVLLVGGRNLKAGRSFPSRSALHGVQSLSTSLSSLCLAYCALSEADIPRVIGRLSSLKYLDLSGNSFHLLHFEFSELRSLWTLKLNDCENLHSLLSVSNLEDLKIFSVKNCKKLVRITELDNLPSILEINMVSCSSLQNPFNEGFFSAPALASRTAYSLLDIYLQSSEIPEWCNNQVTASSICFTMPNYNEYQFLGMIIWCVREFVNVLSCNRLQGLSFCITEKMSSSLSWSCDGEIPTRHIGLSCVFYRSYLQTPFHGQIKGGEKIEVSEFGGVNTVKKIGIHLLYLDQQGKVTSLPAVMDYSDDLMKRSRQINDDSVKKYLGVSTGQHVDNGGRFEIWCNISSLVRYLSGCFSP